MKSMMKALTINSLAAAALVAGSAQGALAGPPTNVSVTVTAQNSTGAILTANGENYFYDYEIKAGQGIADLLPIQICADIAKAGDGPGFPFDVAFGPNGAGGNLPGVTKPATITFSLAGCQTVHIAVATNAMAAGNYSQLVTIAGDNAPPDTNVKVDNNSNIHIRAKVTAGDPTTCFITSSSFEFLLDCAGNLVTKGDGGRFAIVTNKKNVQVATNPGQFYYNILWTNTTGAERTIKVNIDRQGVRTQGAQALHAKVFPSFPAIDETAFAAVNDAIPSGADDKLESVVVPDGWTIWVSYHLEWETLGSLISATSATTCAAANQSFLVLGTVSDAVTGESLGTCSAGAAGYRK